MAKSFSTNDMLMFTVMASASDFPSEAQRVQDGQMNPEGWFFANAITI